MLRYLFQTGVINLWPSQEVKYQTWEYTSVLNDTIDYAKSEYATVLNSTMEINKTLFSNTTHYDKTEYQNLNDYLHETLVYTNKLNITQTEIVDNNLPFV